MAKDDKMSGESEENVYSGDVREDLVDSGEISPEEEGFMAGYDEAEEDDEDSSIKKKKKKRSDDEEDEDDEEREEE